MREMSGSRAGARGADRFGGELIMAAGMGGGARTGGRWMGELYRPPVGLLQKVLRWKEDAAKDGMSNLAQLTELLKAGRMELIDRWFWHNIIVNIGLDQVLSVYYGSTAKPVHYVGLKDTGTPVAGDTMASHGSWVTITPYSDATDPAYTATTASGQSIDNSASKASFAIDATDTVYGAFLKDENTKGGTAGILHAAGDFGASRAVSNGDTLNVTGTFTQADDGV